MEVEIPQRCELSLGETVDGYSILKKLGEGSFGIVYKVKEASTGRIYAFKLLKLWAVTYDEDRQALARRFQMEYETGLIDSEHLVHTVGVGRYCGNPYILMDFCPGGDLRQRIPSKFSDSNIKLICSGVLKGMNALHVNGKVHRDLKPENVLFDKHGNALLTDFGISGDKNRRMTTRNIFGVPKEIFGTYAYMPPEQLKPVKDATVLPTTDIFSFGVLLYETITGQLPYGRLENQGDLTDYIMRANNGNWNRAQMSNRAGIWSDVIEGCLEPDYKKRYNSTDVVLNVLGVVKDAERSDDKRGGRIGEFKLRIMQGEEYGREYELTSMFGRNGAGLLKIGRLDDGVVGNVLIVETQSCYVSRHHCTIERNMEHGIKWFIRDGQWRDGQWQESTNGTFVNGVNVGIYGCEIKDNDIISVGDVTMRVEVY